MHAQNPWIGAHRSSRDEVSRLLAIADRDIEQSQAPGLGPQWSFDIACTRTSSTDVRSPRQRLAGGSGRLVGVLPRRVEDCAHAIERTTVERAVNTDKDVLKAGDLYYMYFQGVWFMSKSPNGPWELAKWRWKP